jgi:hypothetical protein
MASLSEKIREHREHIHPVVFPVSAVLILAVVIYGAGFPDSAGEVFGDVRGWITSNLGWFFIAAGRIFLLFCLYLVVGPLRQGPPRPGRLPAGLQLPHLVRDAVQRRDGHRPGVLGRRRADLPLRRRAAVEGGTAEAAAGRDGADLPPLGARRLVGLRRPRPLAGLLRLPAQPADDDPLGALPADRRPDPRLGRQPRRHPGDLRDDVRDRDLARARRRPDQRRAELAFDVPVGTGTQVAAHRRSSRSRRRSRSSPGSTRASGGCRSSTSPWPAPAAVRRVAGPTVLLLARTWRTSATTWPTSSTAVLERELRGRRRLARRLDDLLLGLVDLLGALRRHVHRPDLPGPHDPRVHPRRAARARRSSRSCGSP